MINLLTIFIVTIIILWFVSEIKNLLFWIYLWQLKNYHIGRFKDHFTTKKGRNIFINPLYILKLLSLFLFLISLKSPYLLLVGFLLTFLIILDGVLSIYKIIGKKIQYPVFTKKIIFLFIVNIFSILAIFKFSNVDPDFFLPFLAELILINVLTPLIVSTIVLTFQPITVLLRFITLNKAINKRKSLKNLTVIGITGSYGKSSTKEFIYTILSSKYKGVKKTPENFNSEMGISNFILSGLKEKDKYFICEMGAYNRGGIKLLCKIADPQIGILTGINNQHLSTFGTQENIVKAKFELIDYVKYFAVINWDNYLIKNQKLPSKTIYKCSYLDKQDICAENIKVFKDHVEFNACLLNGEKEYFKVNVLGGQNISNLLAAIITAYKLGMSLKEIAEAAQKIKIEQGGMAIIDNFIDATYSSNANGVIAHLSFLKLWSGKKVLVMPCLIELGAESKRIHEEIGKKIHEVCDLAIITTEDYFKELKKEGKEKVIFENDSDKILKMLKEFNNKEDIILLESRVPSRIINKIKK